MVYNTIGTHSEIIGFLQDLLIDKSYISYFRERLDKENAQKDLELLNEQQISIKKSLEEYEARYGKDLEKISTLETKIDKLKSDKEELEVRL